MTEALDGRFNYMSMHFRRILLPVFMMLLSAPGFSQTEITLSGRVIDEKNNQPISNAAIADVDRNQGTLTDQDGNFTLLISASGATIRFAHLGYAEKRLEFSSDVLQQAVNGSYTIQVVLAPSPVEISPVDVLGDKLVRAYNKAWIPVIDFEFYGPNLLLLVYENRKYDVRLVTGDDSTLLRTQLDFIPESFFKDCLDQLHVISPATNYRITVLPDTLLVTASSSREAFDSVVLPCAAATKEAYYFGKAGLHNQSVIYIKSMRERNDEKIFAVVRDSIGEQLAQEELQRVIGFSPYAKAQMSDIYMTADLNKARAFLNDLWFYQKIRSIPVYDPLLKLRDSLYLFNHTRHRLNVYDERGKFFRTMPVEYSKDKTWNKQIIIDEARGTAYVAFSRNGYMTLSAFDLSTGRLSGTAELAYALFPESIKIRNGIAYFLLQHGGAFTGYNLFMQPLN